MLGMHHHVRHIVGKLARPNTFFVAPVLIRLTKHRASVPLTPASSMPARAGKPGAQSHRREGREAGGGGPEENLGRASGVPTRLCSSGAQNFHVTAEHWHRHALLVKLMTDAGKKIILTFKTNQKRIVSQRQAPRAAFQIREHRSCSSVSPMMIHKQKPHLESVSPTGGDKSVCLHRAHTPCCPVHSLPHKTFRAIRITCRDGRGETVHHQQRAATTAPLEDLNPASRSALQRHHRSAEAAAVTEDSGLNRRPAVPQDCHIRKGRRCLFKTL